MTRVRRVLAAAAADDRGSTLPELLVGAVVTALVMLGVSSIVFTSTGLQRAAQDRNEFAAAIALVGLQLDRDGAMATAAAPARSQTTAADCATPIDLGFLEGGATVRFRTAASPTSGPFVLERVSGGGARTIAQNVSACSWRSAQESGGRWTIRLDLTFTGPSGETVSQTLRAAPRLW